MRLILREDLVKADIAQDIIDTIDQVDRERAEKPKQKKLTGPGFDPTLSGFRSGRGQLQNCPYGGGEECIKRGGDGAKQHYVGYEHPRDIQQHREAKKEDEDKWDWDEDDEEEGEEPSESLFASKAREKGVYVESHLSSWDLEDRDFDDIVVELFGTDDVDDLIDAYEAKQGDIEASLEQVEVQAGLGKVHGAFYDKTRGRRVGQFERHFSYDHNGELVVEHAYFKLDDDVKSGGLGKQFLRNSIKKYMEMGVEKITVHPAWDGRFVWAKFGFNWGEGGAEYVQATLPEFLEENFGVDRETAEETAWELSTQPWKLAALDVGGQTMGNDWTAGEAYLKSEHGDEVWAQGGEDEDEDGGFIYLHPNDPGFEHLMEYLGLDKEQKRRAA